MYKTNTKKTPNQSGFTLIEILVVIGIIAVLAAIVLVAINPARQFAQARNTQRTSNVTAILDAVGQYTADNQGDLSPLNLPNDFAEITVAQCDLLVPTYLPAMPTDPQSDHDGADIECSEMIAAGNSNYEIMASTSGRVTIQAPNSEDETVISDPAPLISITR